MFRKNEMIYNILLVLAILIIMYGAYNALFGNVEGLTAKKRKSMKKRRRRKKNKSKKKRRRKKKRAGNVRRGGGGVQRATSAEVATSVIEPTQAVIDAADASATNPALTSNGSDQSNWGPPAPVLTTPVDPNFVSVQPPQVEMPGGTPQKPIYTYPGRGVEISNAPQPGSVSSGINDDPGIDQWAVSMDGLNMDEGEKGAFANRPGLGATPEDDKFTRDELVAAEEQRKKDMREFCEANPESIGCGV